MAGSVIRLVPKRPLDFTSVSSGSGAAEELVIAQGIDVSQWREASLMIRTHTSSFFNNIIGQIDINVYVEGRTSEDPGLLFATATPVSSASITASTPPGAYQVISCSSHTGAMLKIAARGTRTNSLSTNSLRADVSIDLSLKGNTR